MRYLVALGSSEGAENERKNRNILDVALRHAVPGRDCLLLARVIEELKPDPVVLLDILYDDDEQLKLEEAEKKKMEAYVQVCMAAKVDCGFVVLVDDHPGAALCKAAVDHKADCIIVGRRALGTFQRLIVVSTSKYCIDNAECNVIVVKKSYPVEDAPHHQEAIKQAVESQHAVGQPQIATEHPQPHLLPATHMLTLRDPTEMQRAFERANASQPKTEEIKLDIVKLSPKRREALLEARRLEESERTRRVQEEWNRENEVERIASQADRELVQTLEEQERVERIRSSWGDIEIERIVRKEESKYDLEIVKKLEEEERKRRIQEWNSDDKTTEERKATLQSVKALEEQERKERIKSWNEEDIQEQEKRKQESLEDRKLVARLEEQERQQRLTDLKAEEEHEKLQRTLERTISLEKIHLAEEQERMDRMRQLHEEDVREQAMSSLHSKQDWELVKKLEDEERERRIREDADRDRWNREKSKRDLQKVKELEEAERSRRVNRLNVME